jgi:hypothetical protein
LNRLGLGFGYITSFSKQHQEHWKAKVDSLFKSIELLIYPQSVVSISGNVTMKAQYIIYAKKNVTKRTQILICHGLGVCW